MLQITKDNLNARLHNEVLGLSDTPVNYVSSATSIQIVLDKLAKDGWAIQAWDSEKRSNIVSWKTGKAIMLQRKMIVNLINSKTKESYESKYIQQRVEVVGNLCRIKSDEPKILLDDIQAALALVLLNAKATPRPANWLIDYEGKGMVYALGLLKINTDGSTKGDWCQICWQTGDTSSRRKQLEAIRTKNPGIYQSIHEFETLADYDVKEKLINQSVRDAE